MDLLSETHSVAKSGLIELSDSIIHDLQMSRMSLRGTGYPEIEGWEKKPNSNSLDYFEVDTFENSPESRAMLAAMYGFGPMSESQNQKNIDYEYLQSKVNMALGETQSGSIRGKRWVNRMYEKGTGKVFFRKNEHHTKLHLYIQQNPFSGETIFIPAVTHGGEIPFSIDHIDALTLDDALDIVLKTKTLEEFKVNANTFNKSMEGKIVVQKIDQESLDKIISEFDAKSSAIISKINAIVNGITNLDWNLDKHSVGTASRVQFSNGSAVFKIVDDKNAAKREYTLLQNIAKNEYLHHFFPTLKMDSILEYGGKYLLLMEDLYQKKRKIPEFTYEHFEHANVLSHGEKINIHNAQDFKVYLAALLHSQSKEIGENMPSSLIGPTYLPYSDIFNRFDGTISAEQRAVVDALKSCYEENLLFLKGIKATTLRHGDMKDTNFVFGSSIEGNIPYFQIDLGNANKGPGILDTIRTMDYSYFMGIDEFDGRLKEMTKTYEVFRSVFASSGKISEDQLDVSMQIARSSVVVDGTRMVSWKEFTTDKKTSVQHMLAIVSQYATSPKAYLAQLG